MKLSKDLLESFNHNIISILSLQRLQSYGDDIHKHYQNLSLALEAGKRIANLEIYLRNKMDFVLQCTEGEDWIRTPSTLILVSQKGHTPLSNLDRHQILSGLMLGEIVGLINFYRIEHYIFDLQDFDFKKAQDKLKTLLGVFSYDETDEKQVYLSFPNFREKI